MAIRMENLCKNSFPTAKNAKKKKKKQDSRRGRRSGSSARYSATNSTPIATGK
ncbi:hypothetical protein GJ744_005161 [Endocarpon pusillum]|uniref:Uncharacterized protein n=1 Tax=Endocarpon pusillum TaxID=364733 RepID=A0A8H7A910_9EURO|nr:hypothetical protein GJ744_005161 [Endocarpon pusillum]